jgi:hypothetical protein
MDFFELSKIALGAAAKNKPKFNIASALFYLLLGISIFFPLFSSELLGLITTFELLFILLFGIIILCYSYNAKL